MLHSAPIFFLGGGGGGEAGHFGGGGSFYPSNTLDRTPPFLFSFFIEKTKTM